MNLKPALLQPPHYCTEEQPGLSEGFPKQTRTPGLPSASAEPRDSLSPDSELSTAQALPCAQTPAAICQLLLDTEQCQAGDNWLQSVD